MSQKIKRILKKIVPAAVVVCAIIILSGCQKNSAPGSGGGEEKNAEKSEAMKPIIVKLTIQESSESAGEATLSEENGKVKVELKASGEGVKGVRPAHIHSGNCENAGWSKYMLSYPSDGQSITMLDISPQELMKNLPLSVVIKESEKKDSKIVSCGEIK